MTVLTTPQIAALYALSKASTVFHLEHPDGTNTVTVRVPGGRAWTITPSGTAIREHPSQREETP